MTIDPESLSSLSSPSSPSSPSSESSPESVELESDEPKSVEFQESVEFREESGGNDYR